MHEKVKHNNEVEKRKENKTQRNNIGLQTDPMNYESARGVCLWKTMEKHRILIYNSLDRSVL